jgi:glucose/arabinose dehydrogenase
VIIRVHTSADPTSHDGGQLAFGTDGRLYAGTGDGLDRAAPHPASLLGKELPIVVPQLLASSARTLQLSSTPYP